VTLDNLAYGDIAFFTQSDMQHLEGRTRLMRNTFTPSLLSGVLLSRTFPASLKQCHEYSMIPDLRHTMYLTLQVLLHASKMPQDGAVCTLYHKVKITFLHSNAPPPSFLYLMARRPKNPCKNYNYNEIYIYDYWRSKIADSLEKTEQVIKKGFIRNLTSSH
jgi:hypothetical protein